jgi:hypothetical protein
MSSQTVSSHIVSAGGKAAERDADGIDPENAMPSSASTDATVVVATYTSRPDAEMDKARLAEQGIDALIQADDVHSSLQYTEGVKLRVFESRADEAREVLSEGASEPSGEEVTKAQSGWPQVTAGAFLAAFLLMVAVIVIGLLAGL